MPGTIGRFRGFAGIGLSLELIREPVGIMYLGVTLKPPLSTGVLANQYLSFWRYD